MSKKLITTLPLMVALFALSTPALAEGGAAAAAAGDGSGMIGLSAGLAVGLAALGSGLGQGRLGAAAMEGMARNPEAGGDIRTSMLIGLAFPESLVLFCFAISFLLLGKI